MNLHAVNTKTGCGVKLLMANMALEMLRLLMLNKNLLVVKLPVAIPGETRNQLELSAKG